MAILLSEDEEIKTSIELIVLPSSSWLPYKLVLTSGNQKLVFAKDSDKGTGDYVFATTPVDELKVMIERIESFLKDIDGDGDSDKKLFSFEPAEPSFELIIEKTYKGYSVTCWVDSGNVISDHYSWDAFGVRFFTTKEKIKLFIDKLKCQDEVT